MNELTKIIAKHVQEQTARITAERDKWRDRCEWLIGHYGGGVPFDEIHTGDFAQQIQKEIDDDTTRPS